MKDELDELLRSQCGLISVGQAEVHEVSMSALRHRVRAGRWQRVHPGAYATFTGSLDVEQRIWAGYLYAGTGAVVGYRSAWWWVDRKTKAPEIVEVVVPHQRAVRSVPGVIVRRTRRLDPADVHPIEWPKRFRIERAVLDCAAEAASSDQAAAILASSVQRRTTTTDRLREVLDRLPNLTRRVLLKGVLELAEAGSHTLIEIKAFQACTSHGLPAPDRQRQIDATCADAAFDMPLGTVLAEFDGKLGHFDAASWWKDFRRDNGHMSAGLATLRFPGYVLLSDPHTIAATIAEALTLRGWTGALACPPGCPGPVDLDAG